MPYTECSIRHATYDYIYVTRSQAELDGWERSAVELIGHYAWLRKKAKADGIEGVHDVGMQGRFNEGCVFCPMKEWCRLGRPTSERMVKATFVSSHWDPRVRD